MTLRLKVMSAYNLVVHYLFPHESNNQKPKLLHSSTLIVISFLLVFWQLVLSFLPTSGLRILGYAANISLEEVVRLTNEKRAQAGLSPLELNSQLSEAARNKGNDMLIRDYWAHVSPDGTEPWRFFTDVGYSYRYAGENLARDFSNASGAVEAWMASPTHKDNLLSGKYQEIGLAVVEGDLNGVDTTIIVQLFGTKVSGSPQTLPVAKSVPEAPQAVAVAKTPQPTFAPTPVPELALATPLPVQPEQYLETKSPPVQGESKLSSPNILISPFTTTRGISLFVVGFLLLVLLLDAVLTSKRRIARIGGRTFAHMSFLGMILAIAIILKAGQIL